MIDRNRLLSMGYYNKAASFTGSDGNKCYRIEKFMQEETIETTSDSGEVVTETSSVKKLMATIWPGPFSFENTPDEKKQKNIAEFSDAGLQELVDWMNQLDI